MTQQVYIMIIIMHRFGIIMWYVNTFPFYVLSTWNLHQSIQLANAHYIYKIWVTTATRKYQTIKLHTFSIAYLRHTSNYTPSNNTLHLEKSAVCHVAILNYSPNYMNRCSIITNITIKILIRWCVRMTFTWVYILQKSTNKWLKIICNTDFYSWY